MFSSDEEGQVEGFTRGFVGYRLDQNNFVYGFYVKKGYRPPKMVIHTY